jgi:ATP-binding cassette subfamily F protein uup
MAPPILTLQNIFLNFGGPPLLEGAELTVSEGERLCLVGRNGSGKSTLLKIAAALVEPDDGERFIQPGITHRYLDQEPDLGGFASALDYVTAGLGPADDRYRAGYLLEQLGLGGTEDPATMSGGEMRRCALARALAPEPDILFLDEPTNHLDLTAIEWLETELKRSTGALVLISHDRRFLQNLTRRTLWLDRGCTRLLEQGFAAFEKWRDETLEQEEIDRHKRARKIVAEEHWLRYGVTARRKRNQKRLRDLVELRRAHREERRATGSVSMDIAEGKISGKMVIEARSITKAFDGKQVVRDFSCRIHRSDRIGILGPNGAGKTTLLNMLTGKLKPDSGEIRLGAGLDMVWLDQKRAALAGDTPLVDALTGGHSDKVQVGDGQRHVISYMKDFLFAPEQLRTPISELSGGERGRLMLARAFATPSNLLVLDEPTNDLDLETLDLLQERLADYNGTVLLVSHDRDFIDRVVTSVIAFEGDGRWQSYAGGYTDMLAQRRGAAREAAASPTEARKKTTRLPQDKPQAQRKLSYKQKYALEKLPAKMDALHADIARHQQTLADPRLYSRDPEGFARISKALHHLEADLAAAEDEWLALEMLREELEGG